MSTPRSAEMTPSAESQTENLRLTALRSHQILDTPPEAAFDRITALAARLFQVPMALVSFVDADRQWSKSSVGIDICQTRRSVSFCSHVIEQRQVMVVPDANLDPRFAESELVLGVPFVRFYAGAPLIDRDGLALGSLCVLDVVPRNLDAEGQQTLQDLAALVVDELELRRAAHQLHDGEVARNSAQKALLDSQNRFRVAFQFSPIGMSLTSPDGKCLQANQSLCHILGCSEEQLLDGNHIALTHPDDQNENLELVKRALSGEIDSYQLEKRYMRADGSQVWCSLSASLVRDEVGKPLYFISQVQDISARKQIEDDLRDSEARKAAILETALDCIITIDTSSRILEWNPAAEKTFGFSRQEALESRLHELIVPEKLRAAHREGLEKWEATGIGPILGKRIELPAVRKDGTPITVELAVVPIPGSDPPLFTGHLRDISERRANEERLRLLESVAVNANDAILITEAEPVDLPGPRIRYVNRAFLEMTGYSLDEVVGQTPRMLQGEGTSEESRAKISQALKSWKPIVIDMLNYKKDGTPFWVELSINPVANAKGWYTHWVSVQRDISERRETLDALRESEARYGRIATNVPGMVYQFVMGVDASFTFRFVSEGCREICGLEPSQIMEDANAIISYVHPRDMHSFQESILRSAQTLEAWQWEGRIEVPKQGVKWLRGTSKPKREPSGEVIWDGILFDITGPKKQEELLQNAKNEAEAAREEAERANIAKSEFLSRMSHELRTPLNAILGFGQLLEIAELPEEDAESAAQILGAGRHLLDLINEVLDIARIEAGHLSLSSEPVSVREMTLETLDLVRPLIAQSGITLDDAAIRSSEVYVRADRQRLKQVLLNLLSNAVKYGGENGQVTLSCELTAQNRVRIGVRDNGPGIAPELRSRLFTAFDRLGAENSNIEGTGVGLALSLRLMHAMDGNLNFESEDGQGSVFWIELPSADDVLKGCDSLNTAPRGLAIADTKLVVLYIEDNASNLQLVQRLLAHRPEIRLLTATRGGTGYELARDHTPDLILLDINLPDISGHEVLRLLQTEPQTSAIPVVVVSADATSQQIGRMLESGAQTYLTKPFDVREFLGILDGGITKNERDTCGEQLS